MKAPSANTVTDSKPEIVVGIKLGHDASWLVKTASAVALACHASLKLVHVIETKGVTKEGGRMVDIAQEYLDRDIGVVYRDLERLKDLCSVETNPEIVVLRGFDPSALLSSPELFPLSIMLIIGSETHFHRFIPKGISMVMNLLGQMNLPVLIVHDNETMSRTWDSIHIVIADDLTLSFKTVLEKAIRLVRHFPNPRIFHIHIAESNVSGEVCPLTRLADPRPWSSVETVLRWDSACETMKKELESRWTSAVVRTLGGDHVFDYRAEVITDQPMHGLLKSQADFKADMIVVGPLREFGNAKNGYARISKRKLLDKSEALLVVPV